MVFPSKWAFSPKCSISSCIIWSLLFSGAIWSVTAKINAGNSSGHATVRMPYRSLTAAFRILSFWASL